MGSQSDARSAKLDLWEHNKQNGGAAALIDRLPSRALCIQAKRFRKLDSDVSWNMFALPRSFKPQSRLILYPADQITRRPHLIARAEQRKEIAQTKQNGSNNSTFLNRQQVATKFLVALFHPDSKVMAIPSEMRPISPMDSSPGLFPFKIQTKWPSFACICFNSKLANYWYASVVSSHEQTTYMTHRWWHIYLRLLSVCGRSGALAMTIVGEREERNRPNRFLRLCV